MSAGQRAMVAGAVMGLRLVLGLMFAYAGVSKVQSRGLFLEQVYSYELAGPALGLLVSIFLPALELVVAVSLLSACWLEAGFLLSALLSALFTFAQWHALRHGLSIDCGCFGSTPQQPQQIGYLTIARSGVIFLASLLASISQMALMLVSSRIGSEKRSKSSEQESSAVTHSQVTGGSS